MNGPEKGKQGTVLKVIRAQNRVVIEGVNVVRFCVCVGVYVDVWVWFWCP